MLKMSIPFVAVEAICSIFNVEKRDSVKIGVAQRASEAGGVERGVQGTEDPVHDGLLAVVALGLRGIPTSPMPIISIFSLFRTHHDLPAHVAVLGGIICAVKNGETFVALEAVKMIIDVIDHETVICDPCLTLKTKLLLDLSINIFKCSDFSFDMLFLTSLCWRQ